MRACVEWDANLPLAVIARAIHADAGRPVEAGASFVFDLGYYDYGIKARYCTPCYLSASAELDAAGCRIVTRFKSNTPPRTIEDRPVAKDGAILSHRVEYRLVRQPKNRKDSFRDPVREVRVRGETRIKALTRERRDLPSSSRRIGLISRIAPIARRSPLYLLRRNRYDNAAAGKLSISLCVDDRYATQGARRRHE